MNDQLLIVVEVDKSDRVICQANGCGHGVFRRIHVVRHIDGSLGVYGSACFEKFFGHRTVKSSYYGDGDGRKLNAHERQMLAENTEYFIAQFEAEHLAELERGRLRREQQEIEGNDALHAAKSRQQPTTSQEIASVEREAKALVRKKFGVDPDSPGWRGLVLHEVRKLTGL